MCCQEVKMADKDSPRYVEFVRVSSKGQAERDTPEIQRTALDRLRETRPGILVERIEEAGGISGTKGLAERPDLQRLQQLTERRDYDEIRVYAIDRLTRAADPRERFAVFGMALDADAVLVDTRGHVVDPADDSGSGELEFYLHSFFAAREAKKIVRRTRDGLKRAAAKGRPVGRTIYEQATEPGASLHGWPAPPA